MPGLDPANGARAGAGDEGLGAQAPVPLVAHASEQVAVGDPGGGEEAVVPLDQVIGQQDGVDVVALGLGQLALLVVAGPQPALQLAPHALDGAGGQHSLGGAADAEEDVDPGSGPGGGHDPGHVAVGDQPDAGADVAD